MEDNAEAQNPVFVLATLHQQFPQFAEKDPKGGFKQQDANEAWLAVVQFLELLKVYIIS